MNTNLKKIAKTAAVGLFFMALFLNVKLSLTDPFMVISNEVIAQTTSSGSSSGSVIVECISTPYYGSGMYFERICLNGNSVLCQFDYHNQGNPRIGYCYYR